MDCSGEEKAPSRPLSRGELLKRAGVVGAAATVPGALASEAAVAASEGAEGARMLALSPSQARTIAAFCERLIPSDRTGGGAREANVIRYIDRALAGDLLAFRPAYTAAVQAIDGYSDFRFGAAFADLTPERQDQIVRELEQNQLSKSQDPTITRPIGAATPSTPEFTPNPRAVFEMIRTHALQGMFGDPAHGGNANFIGWRLVRFPGPRLVIDAADQRLNVRPKAKMQSTYSYALFRGRMIPGG